MRRFNPDPIHGFTTEELITIRSVVERIWNKIADDMFIGDDGQIDYNIEHNRNTVVEICLDAGRYHYECDEKEKAIIERLIKVGWMNGPFKEITERALPCDCYVY